MHCIIVVGFINSSSVEQRTNNIEFVLSSGVLYINVSKSDLYRFVDPCFIKSQHDPVNVSVCGRSGLINKQVKIRG